MAYLFFETIDRCNIYIATEEFREFTLECCMLEKGGTGRKLDKEIDVAAFAGLMTGDGPEDADIFDPEPTCKYKDRLSFFSDYLIEVHNHCLLPDRYTVRIINALTMKGF